MLGKETTDVATKPVKEKKEKLPKEPKIQLTKEEKEITTRRIAIKHKPFIKITSPKFY